MNINLTTTLTREEAEAGMAAISRAMQRQTQTIKNVQRKRSWLPSVRAMECADILREQEKLMRIYKALGEAYGLGGY